MSFSVGKATTHTVGELEKQYGMALKLTRRQNNDSIRRGDTGDAFTVKG